MIDNSEGFVDEGQATGGEITPEMEDQFRQIEALASMDAAFANSQEYKDLMAATRGTNSQSSETDDEEEEYEDEDEDEILRKGCTIPQASRSNCGWKTTFLI